MSRAGVIVAGMVAGDPFQGGATWAAMQYVLGLRSLGCDVVLVDPVSPGAVNDRVRSYFDAVCARFELTGRAVLLDGGEPAHGMSAPALAEAVRRATVLINLSGRWRDPDRLAGVPIRAYVDLDPAFTQLWHAQGIDVGLDAHTHRVTVGAGVAAGTAAVPTAGPSWRSMLPPVALDHWPVAAATSSPRCLTTVANWRSYGSVEHEGRHFGQKAHAFRGLAGLPAASPLPLGVALTIHPGDDADRNALLAAGWRVFDPLAACGDPDRYRRFVQGSWAEIGVAKAGYVTGRTGWFSDRTACYLASGRPAVVQDTGLDGVVPTGEGLLTFSTAGEAAEAIARIAADYPAHRAAARRLAEVHLDARRVLGDLMEDLLA